MKRKKRLTLGSCDNKSNGGLKIYGDLRIVSRTRWLSIKVAEGKLQLNTRAKLEQVMKGCTSYVKALCCTCSRK